MFGRRGMTTALPMSDRLRIGEDAIVEAIYDSTTQPSVWPLLLDAVARAAGGDVACLFDFDPGPQQLRRALVNHLPDASAYHARYAALDPRNRYGIRQAEGTVFTDAAFITSGEVARSEFYQDYLIANGMGHVGARVLEQGAQAIVGLAIQRSIRRPAFELAELDILERLTPHLRRALRLQRALAVQGAEPAAWSRTCLDSLAWPVLLLDREARLVFASASAEALLRAGDGLRCVRAKLSAWHPWDARCLGEAILRGLAGGGAELRLRRSGGGVLLVSVVPLGRSALEPLDSHHPRVALYVLDPTPPVTDAQARLAAWFQLSPAEARLAAALLDGEALPRIAERFALAPSTLKTQLARLFVKTDTNRQGELIALLQRVAQLPVAPKGANAKRP